MSASPQQPGKSERIFARLLRLFPRGFRSRFGRDMCDLFRDQLAAARARSGALGVAALWARTLGSLMIAAVLERRDALRATRSPQATPVWRSGMLERSMSDLRFAVRMLRKNPVFTIVAVLAISLGSGAVTTIFSATNALLLRPIPGVRDGDRLVGLELMKRDGHAEQSGTLPLYEYLRDGANTLSGLAAWEKVTFSISAGGEGSVTAGNFVSANYFSVLGLKPALGRFFLPEEDRTPLTHPVIVVSHAFWTSHLNTDSSAIGRAVSVNGHPYTLIGVAPRGFRGVITLLSVDGWVPLMMQSRLQPERNVATAQWLRIIGRLKDGVDITTAQAELSTLAAAHATGQSDIRPARRTAAIRLAMLHGVPQDARGSFAGFMALLLGAATLVLLIASVNVASMLSARAVARRREMVLRAALGAGRGRLVAQLLTEILVLFALGAAGGAALAFAATHGATLVDMPADVLVAPDMTPDLRVMAFALCASLCTGLIFGLAPALRASRNDLAARLRDATPGAGTRRTAGGTVLIVGQLALSLVLLVAAGLFLRALTIANRVDPGFDPAGMSVVSLDSRTLGYGDSTARRFFDDLGRRVAAVPGVTDVTYASFAPLTTRSLNDKVVVGGDSLFIWLVNVRGDYFSTLRMPIVAGRSLARSDNERAPRVAVINETMARRLAPNGNALGRTFTRGGRRVTVVGIARDAKYAGFDEVTPPLAYFSIDQYWQPHQRLLVRSNAAPASTAAGIAEAMRSIDPALPRPSVETLARAMGVAVLPQRIAAIVTGILGGVGLVLAALGLYGVIAYSVNRRAGEMGVRVALGAKQSDVLRLVLREGLRLALAGVTIGLILAAAATRLIAGFLFDVSPLDLGTFAGMSLVFVAVALVAAYVPARRAAASDPMAVLRSE